MSRHLAIYNFGLHVAPYESPEVEGFRLRETANFEAAARAGGYVGRSGYGDDPGLPSWGPQVFPRFIEGSGFLTAPSSLSVWTDIESLMAFSYSGVHAEALKGARSWNVKQRWPVTVLWWIDAGRVPEWKDGVEKLEQLDDRGASASAFSFKEPYDADGRPATIDRQLVRRLADENAEGQRELLTEVTSLAV